MRIKPNGFEDYLNEHIFNLYCCKVYRADWKHHPPDFDAVPSRQRPLRNEPVATDSFYSDTPAVDSGATCAQIYVGLKTFFTLQARVWHEIY